MSAPSVDVYDVAIILGARIRADGTPSLTVVRRVEHGVHLLRAGRVRALLMTGGATGSAVPEAWVMRDLALAAGVPAALVLVEDRSSNTIENALFSAPLVRDAGWRHRLVITDSYHAPRAAYIFRRLGPTAAVVGVRPARPSGQWWLAHLREICALPWTILRVERRNLWP